MSISPPQSKPNRRDKNLEAPSIDAICTEGAPTGGGSAANTSGGRLTSAGRAVGELRSLAGVVEALLEDVRLIVREELREALSTPSAKRAAEATNQAPELLRPHDVAKLLGVTEPTVREWIHRGELPAARVGTKGRRLVVRRVDVDAYLRARSADAASHVDLDEQAARIVSFANARVARASRVATKK